jgi:hypothetical protein
MKMAFSVVPLLLHCIISSGKTRDRNRSYIVFILMLLIFRTFADLSFQMKGDKVMLVDQSLM